MEGSDTPLYRATLHSEKIRLYVIESDFSSMTATRFGGYKQSGFGKDMSGYTFDDYTEVKHPYVDLTGDASKSWLYVRETVKD